MNKNKTLKGAVYHFGEDTLILREKDLFKEFFLCQDNKKNV